MKLGIMQPYFFPYLGYWQLIAAVDKFIILDDVNFIKQGWINRNNILVQNQAKPINLIVSSASSFVEIRELKVNEKKWQKKLLTTIEFNYKKAPYFKEVYPLLETLINHSETNLSKYLVDNIKGIAQYLNINTQIIETSSIYPKNELKGQDRIIDICNRESAKTYINAINGKDLYQSETFKKQGVDLNFIQMNEIRYKQFNADFVPYLSIIDVLMFNSVEEVRLMLKQYDLTS